MRSKMLLSLTCFLILVLYGCSSEETMATVTKEEYKKLKEGMTLEEVKEIVGGIPKSDNKIDDQLKEYTFKGEKGVEDDSSITLLFNEDKLDTIMESGLVAKIEDSGKKLLTIDAYEVMKEEVQGTGKYIHIKKPDGEKYLYPFSEDNIAKHLVKINENKGYDAIWIFVHLHDGTNVFSGRLAYTQRGLAMTGADKIGEIITK